MVSYSCLITETFHPILNETLENAGIHCTIQEDIQTEGVEQIIQNFDVLIVNSKILVSSAMIQKATKLKVIGRVGSGMEIIDVEACKIKGVKVHSAPEGNAPAVGEHALGLLLDLMRHISKSNHEMSKGGWIREGNRGDSLYGKKVGIIGFGHTGKAFAKVLAGFDVQVLAHDIAAVDNPFGYVKMTDLKEIFKDADIVSLHLPLNDHTHFYANESFFGGFKKPIYFLNTSRGKVCKTADLIDALHTGKVKGAGLDVFENEKPESFTIEERVLFERLKQLPYVVTTPHIAGWTKESKEQLASIIAAKILKELNR